MLSGGRLRVTHAVRRSIRIEMVSRESVTIVEKRESKNLLALKFGRAPFEKRSNPFPAILGEIATKLFLNFVVRSEEHTSELQSLSHLVLSYATLFRSRWPVKSNRRRAAFDTNRNGFAGVGHNCGKARVKEFTCPEIWEGAVRKTLESLPCNPRRDSNEAVPELRCREHERDPSRLWQKALSSPREWPDTDPAQSSAPAFSLPIRAARQERRD